MKKTIYLILIAVTVLTVGCRSKAERAEEAMRKGIHQLWSIHDNKKAMEYFETYSNLLPDDAKGYFFMGTCLMNEREYEKAIAMFNKAISFKIDYADAYYNKGQCYSLLKNKDEACKCYFEALAHGKLSIEDKINDCNRWNTYMSAQDTLSFNSNK